MWVGFFSKSPLSLLNLSHLSRIPRTSLLWHHFSAKRQDYPELLSFSKPCKEEEHSGVKALEGKVKFLFVPSLSARVPQGYQYFTRLRAREGERHAQSTVAGGGGEEGRGGRRRRRREGTKSLHHPESPLPPPGTVMTYSQYSVRLKESKKKDESQWDQ